MKNLIRISHYDIVKPWFKKAYYKLVSNDIVSLSDIKYIEKRYDKHLPYTEIQLKDNRHIISVLDPSELLKRMNKCK